MLDTIRELFTHQSWADAEHWRAILASPAAAGSEELKERLLHLHGAQKVWLDRFRGAAAGFPTLAQFPTIAALHGFAQDTHRGLDAYAESLDEASLGSTVRYRDLKGNDHAQPLGGLMLHLAMHSQYHRGQNASLMKRLGTPAPPTDFVVWMRGGRPAASWA